ncbi:MAG: hypothetical protein RLZZ546_1018 [Bacteroidota bacterium]
MIISSWSFSQITSVGLIGPGSPSAGWDTDTDLTQNPDSSHLWSAAFTLSKGEVKFRADDKWDVNWGDKTCPYGVGFQGGPNVQVPTAGDYLISFNSKTGEYFFDFQSTNVGIIGAAMPIHDWNRDINMFPGESPGTFFIVLTLEKDGLLFRENDNWDLKFGSDKSAPNFPSGSLVKGGGNDIKVETPGEYLITIDTIAKTYKFEVTGYRSIGIIGDATPTGWNSDTDMNKVGPDDWEIKIDLVDGPLKFRADDDWANNWGGTAWPQGIGVSNSSDNIPAKAGRYLVKFNSKTAAYNFIEIKKYNLVGIIGDATSGGVDTPTPMVAKADDEGVYTLRTKLKDGFLQFVTDDDRWASGDFPSGTAEIDGGDIPVTVGDYKITFNSVTGAYSFEAVIEFDKISLVGKSGPFGDWPGTDDSRDTYLDKDLADPNHWTLAEVVLADHGGANDDGVKFRANAAWATNWGAEGFPSGVGVQNGPNIKTVAGTYKIDFRSDTGDYGFSEPSSTYNILSSDVINVFPNPTSSFINIDVKQKELKGNTSVKIFDQSGKMIYNKEFDSNQMISIDVTKYTTGTYIVQLTNGKYILGKRVAIIK